MKFLKWFLLSLCVIFVVLVAIFYANKIQEKRMFTLQNDIYTYLSDMKQLETMTIDYQKDIILWADVLPNVVTPEILNNVNKKNIYSFSGSVSAGIDFSKLSSSGVILEKWIIVNISLPASEILKIFAAYIPQEVNGKIIQNGEEQLKEATQKAMTAMKDAASSQNIIELAKVNAEKKIKEELLKKYTNVKDVVFK